MATPAPAKSDLTTPRPVLTKVSARGEPVVGCLACRSGIARSVEIEIRPGGGWARVTIECRLCRRLNVFTGEGQHVE